MMATFPAQPTHPSELTIACAILPNGLFVVMQSKNQIAFNAFSVDDPAVRTACHLNFGQ